MTEIRSKEVHVAVSADELKAYLQDLNNLEGLLPSDKVKDFKATDDEASFKIQGGLEIRLTRTSEAFEGDVLRLLGGGAPFRLSLGPERGSNGKWSPSIGAV